MDLEEIKKSVLNEEARINGFANWDSMKIIIKDNEAVFIERIVRKAIKKTFEIKLGQQTLF